MPNTLQRRPRPDRTVNMVVALVGVCGLLASAAGRVEASAVSRTLPLSGLLHATYSATKCPAGTPAMTEGSLTPCYLVIAHGTIQALGNVVDRKIAVVLHSTTRCPQLNFNLVLTVGTRGTITAAGAKRCVDLQADVKTLPFKITGGTGAFAGATGSGTVMIIQRASDPSGTETEKWKGKLTLPK